MSSKTPTSSTTILFYFIYLGFPFFVCFLFVFICLPIRNPERYFYHSIHKLNMSSKLRGMDQERMGPFIDGTNKDALSRRFFMKLDIGDTFIGL